MTVRAGAQFGDGTLGSIDTMSRMPRLSHHVR
jgi:hypothetical protein